MSTTTTKLLLVLLLCLPCLAANDPSGDPNLMAWWRFENGALTTDSGDLGHTLSNTGVDANTADYKEGAASAEFERSDPDEMSIPDANLASGWPGKNGTTNYDFTVTQWIQPESQPGVHAIMWSKNQSAWSGGTRVSFYLQDVYFYLRLSIAGSVSINSGDINLVNGQWYFIAASYQSSNGLMRIYTYDADADTILSNNTGTYAPGGSGYPVADSTNFYIGSSNYVGGGLNEEWDGLIDEMMVFNKVLSVDDINDVRDGLYVVSGSSGQVMPLTITGY
jgi:hypothetical protein